MIVLSSLGGNDYVLQIDGESVDKKRYSISQTTKAFLRDGAEKNATGAYETVYRREIFVHDTELATSIMSHKASEVPVLIGDIILPIHDISDSQLGFMFYLILERRLDLPNFYMHIDIRVNFNDWKKTWSIREYSVKLKERLIDFEVVLRGHFRDVNIYPVKDVHVATSKASIDRESAHIISEVKTAHIETVQYLEALTGDEVRSEDKNSVTARFVFPQEVSVACEQYLQYFAQFLRDAGVEVATRLEHEAGEVLFTVTPVDKDQALEKIHAALTLYLQMAGDPITAMSLPYNTSIQVQRLAANIMHLQSQLALERAVLEAKNETIAALRERVEGREPALTSPDAITPQVFVEAVRAIESVKKDKDKEEVLGGLVQLTTVDLPGAKVSLAEGFRMVKGWFAKKKDTDS